MLTLGIESSCDETAAAVVRDGRTVLSNIIASQHDLHAEYAGVVPEIASRAHLERITPVIDGALKEAGVALEEVDAIAVGNRPGLIGSLLVGVSAAKALAWSLGKPLVGIDHIKAHLYAATMTPGSSGSDAKTLTPSNQNMYPALGLVVSGGHTSLFAVRSPLEMELLGKSIDDAVGEAYDKAAVVLGLPFPGGPKLDKLAQRGDPNQVSLPRSTLAPGSLDFSFSGLKTAMLYAVRGQPVGRGKSARFERSHEGLSEQEKYNLAASFQKAAVETVLLKLHWAVDHMADQGKRPLAILVGGGVSANSALRKGVVALGEELNLLALVPPMSLCLDNAAMIAGLAYERLLAGESDRLDLEAIATT
ncbi:MAG: tRNA (adenosine(37)-N6)-threonylcarbamoyltransferase complex transferase subunit TsaD [Phycisphaera sp.]|nr:tRNA (adenosine(37)-N6)-threonylcarbamoyltransferase complex transferase subunit TsaD [Phycisphaera sp.]